ncbi:hypothetical protein Rhe02_73360 [Rhizocola hellebori]|uniref:Uncharacterized protein n=1 Tax=Rhizocola hellebori TaxID=1392758 RepID=A0A8J3QEB8_9ACTN|nr:hypothetical protein [Rhizocola hellebori]GIH09269.1 hypothetical protein Rhe02_73360 [Rhizocola hellebori]
MQWDNETRLAVETALNESEVLGVRLGPCGGWCDLLLHVLALPEAGPIDPDTRRILRLTSPTQVKILLRADRMAASGYGPVIPLGNLDAVEEFFASLSWTGSMYGWKFLDDSSLTHDWPAETSLTIDIRPPAAAPHTLYWFNECGRDEAETKVGYCIEGTVAFESLAVLRADATPQPLSEFVFQGQNYWRALQRGDERLGVQAQRAAQSGAPSWRHNVRN